MKAIRNVLLRWARARQPDFVIGGHEQPYLRRHWLIPRNRFFNIYVHEFLRSDDDRALHDHPWLFNASWLIEGEYLEHTPIRAGAAVGTIVALRRAGDFKFRWGSAPHRVELISDSFHEVAHSIPCWTVFITGPVVRMWGFHCPKGWVPWKEFVDSRDKGSVGKGCDD